MGKTHEGRLIMRQNYIRNLRSRWSS